VERLSGTLAAFIDFLIALILVSAVWLFVYATDSLPPGIHSHWGVFTTAYMFLGGFVGALFGNVPGYLLWSMFSFLTLLELIAIGYLPFRPARIGAMSSALLLQNYAGLYLYHHLRPLID